MGNLDSIKDIWKNQGESNIRFTQDDIKHGSKEIILYCQMDPDY